MGERGPDRSSRISAAGGSLSDSGWFPPGRSGGGLRATADRLFGGLGEVFCATLGVPADQEAGAREGRAGREAGTQVGAHAPGR